MGKAQSWRRKDDVGDGSPGAQPRGKARLAAAKTRANAAGGILDARGVFIAVGTGLARSLGRPAVELCGTSAFDLVHAGDVRSARAAFASIMSQGEPGKVRLRVITARGFLPIETWISPVARPQGVTDAVFHARFAHRVASKASPIWVRWDSEFRVLSWGPDAERLFGYAEADVLGKDALSLLATPADRSRIRDLRHHMLAERAGSQHSEFVVTKDGRTIICEWRHTPVNDSDGGLLGFASTAVDIAGSPAKKPSRQSRMLDPLTGVASSALFMDRLERAIETGKRSQTEVAVLLIDLDHFATVNRAVGHRLGDVLLRLVADRLRRCLRGADSLGRLGGDKFLGLLSQVDSRDGATSVARRTLECFAEPFSVDSHRLVETASIGIALFPDDATDADSLLRCADVAMYRAKELGRDSYQFYSAPATAGDRMSLERELRGAADRNELELHFQPQIDFRTGAIWGAEALVRWRHPRRGLLPPSEFVPTAEETGLIIPIGAWVLRTACATMRDWHEAGISVPRMSVNISGRELRRRLVDEVAKVLCDTNIDPDSLELELTETVTMRSSETHPNLLEELKSFGLRLAVDDFGVGYSSLAYLQRFPIDTLKIDRLFVSDCLTNRANGAIVEAIVAMAHGMELQVVAEGIETAAQADYLRSLRCDGAQGFLYSPPLPRREFEQLAASAPDFATSSR